MLYADYAWDVITESAKELLDKHNLEKDQVWNIYSTISYIYYFFKAHSYYTKFVHNVSVHFRLWNDNYIIIKCSGD
jgi:hypothetical protein